MEHQRGDTPAILEHSVGMGCEQGGMTFKLNGSRRWSRSLVTDVTGRVDRLASNRNQDGGKDGGGSLQFLS